MTEGLGVDAQGNPVIDPTENVLNLVESAVRRLDDLRELEARHQRELAEIRAAYDDKLREAESSRLDSIRAVDIGNVSQAAAAGEGRARVLETQVQATAEQQRVNLAAALEPIQNDIADLRRAQYEAQGVKAQTGETRLNLGTLLGGLSLMLVLIFGVIGVIIAATH